MARYGTLGSVKKTTVYLDEGELASLQAMAKRERRSSAELIRLAISRLVGNVAAELPKGAGAYRSGSHGVSASRRRILADAARKKTL